MDKAPLRAQPEIDPDLEEEYSPRRRPFGVTLLLWMVLSLSAWGLLRLVGALNWWDVMSQFGAHLSPLYLSITGAAWTVAGVALFWSIFSRKRWAHRAVLIVVGLWLTGYWIERIFFETPRANLLFTIVLSIFMFAITLVITANHSTKDFLIRSEEHEQPEDSTPA